jgi:hypothetical protein
MAKVTDGLRQLAKANLVPEDEYDFIVREVVIGMGDNNWEKVRCNIVNPPDPALATRRIDYLIGSPDTGDWRGLTQLLEAAQLTNVPDGDFGDGDTRNLVEVEFPGRIYHRQGNRGLEANIAPTVNHDWVAEHTDQSEEDEDASSKRRSRKKTTAKKAKRRGSRR